jgi:phosphate acetyltransferase
METKSIMVISRVPKSGMRITLMGLISMLKQEVQDIALLKPIVSNRKEYGEDIDFFTNYFKLTQDPKNSYGISVSKIKKEIARDNIKNIYETLLEQYEALLNRYDFVLCEGVQSLELEEFLDFDINFEIAKNLQIPVIEIVNGYQERFETIKENITYIIHQSQKEGVQLLGIFVNRVSNDILQKLKDMSVEVPLFLLPEIKELNKPTLLDIIKQTNAKLITTDRGMLERVVEQTKIATMMLDNYLNYLENGDLIIVSGDRSDIIVGTFVASLSNYYPSITGIILTGGIIPNANISKLLEGTNIPALPILALHTNTQESVMLLESVSPQITTDSHQKIALANGIFSEYIDLNLLKKHLSLPQPKYMTPIRFTHMLYTKAKLLKSNILLPESEDERVLRAVDRVLKLGLCDITFLGDPIEIKHKSTLLGLDLSMATIINPKKSKYKDEFIEIFYQLRKEKRIVKAMARELMSRTNYFATMMLYLGYVDGIVSGATHTTRETIKPAFEIIKTRKGVDIISSLFFMLVNNRVLVYADCAINPNPSSKELAQIAINSANIAKSLGIEPKIAMLSYSSGTSGIGEDVEKVRTATQIVKQKEPTLLIEGPIQYDTAIDKKVAHQKMPNSKVAGEATVFIFPDLNTGNNTYKAVQRSANAIAIGPILEGLNKPVNDLSRGCLVEDIINTIAITAIQAGATK